MEVLCFVSAKTYIILYSWHTACFGCAKIYHTMKKLILFSLLYLIGLGLTAQNNNLILFSENGERFQAVLNGVKMNEAPETNVRIEDLNAPQYKLKVIFEDKNLGVMDKNVYFNTMGSELTLSIKQNKKGEYVLRMVSEVPVAQAPPAPSNYTIIHYDPNPQPVVSTGVTVVEQTTTTTTTGTGTPTSSENVNMNVNMGGFGMNVNVNVNESGYNENVNMSTTTTTTTTTTSSGSMNSNVVVAGNPQPATTQVVYVEGYNGAVGCPIPMSQGDYNSAQNSIKSKSFEDSKLTIAKQIINSNCLTSAQVRGLLDLFTFEDTKLDFAKYAYHRTYDLNNYYKVNDAFEFESSIEELDAYIAAQR